LDYDGVETAAKAMARKMTNISSQDCIDNAPETRQVHKHENLDKIKVWGNCGERIGRKEGDDWNHERTLFSRRRHRERLFFSKNQLLSSIPRLDPSLFCGGYQTPSSEN
jgi:hypothetical protein